MLAIFRALQGTFYVTKNQTNHNQQGQSLVELAFILPLLLLLALGTVDMGLGFRTYINLTNAAREGVRWVSLYPDDVAGAMDRITEEAARYGLSPGALGADGITVTFSPNKAQYDAGDEVTVTVAHDYTLMFGGVTGLPSIPFQARAKMVVLYDE